MKCAYIVSSHSGRRESQIRLRVSLIPETLRPVGFELGGLGSVLHS